MSDNTLLFLLFLGFIVVVAKVFYDVGYRNGQDDLLNPPHFKALTEAERNRMLMRLTLPRWRRVLGWAAIVAPGLLFWVLLIAVMRYGASGWLHLVVAVVFFVALGLGARLSDWFWRPFRTVQEEERRARVKDVGGRA